MSRPPFRCLACPRFVSSTALKEAEDAVMAASDLLVEDGDVLLATAAVKVAQAKVAHAVKVTDSARALCEKRSAGRSRWKS